MFQNVIVGWIARRALEVGGLVGALLTAWNNLPPVTQDAILAILGRNWQTITLGALVPLAASLWGYVWSYLSTVKPQVVTADKQQISLKKGTNALHAIEASASVAPQPKTIFERLFNK